MRVILATMVEYRLLLFLTIGQVLKTLWHFEILTWEPKMCNILKTTDCRVKWTKIFDSWNCICRVLFIYNSLNSVWGNSVHFGKFADVKIFKRLLLFQFLFNFNQTLWKAWWSEGNTGSSFYWWSENLKGLATLWQNITSATLPLAIMKLSWIHVAKGQAEGLLLSYILASIFTK